MDSIKAFLESLFYPLTEGSYIEIRLIKPGKAKSLFFDSIDQLLKWLTIAKYKSDSSNVYFGVCPRSGRKGTKNAIKTVNCLWADLDAKDFQEGKAESLKRLRDINYYPSIIVDSGHGLHAYWLLREPIGITGPKDVELVEHHLKAFSKAIGADTSAAELARLLRLPGTINYKDPSNPIPVQLIHLEPEHEFGLSDFDSFLDLEPTGPPRIANPSGWISDTLNNLNTGNRNVSFIKIGGRLHRDGWTQDDIIALLTPHAERTGYPVDDLRKEIAGLSRRYPVTNPFPLSPINEEEMEMESKPMETIPLSSFLEKAPTEIDWAVEGILPKEGAGILASPPGYGKSWMLLDLAVEIASGGKWLSHFETTKGCVLYIDEESSPSLLGRRFNKLLAAKNIDRSKLDIHLAIGQGLSFSDKASVERLRELLYKLNPALVIIDSLIRVHGVEENSASEMAGIFKEVKDLIRVFGCAFLFADHQRKPGNFSAGLDTMLRGSSEKTAFVDTLLSLQRKDEILMVEHSKSRYAEPVQSFVVEIKDLSHDATIVAYGGDADAIKQEIRLEAAKEFVLMALGDNAWKTRKNLVDQAKENGISEKALDEALKTLNGIKIERENRKATDGRGGKAAYYRMKSNFSASPFPDAETETETEYANETK